MFEKKNAHLKIGWYKLYSSVHQRVLRGKHGFCAFFQTVQDGRQFMKYIDPHLGVPLPERDYGGNCLIYDPGNESDPFHNIWVRNK